MRWVDAARARLRLLLFGGEVEKRMDEEFRFHLDMETERLVREGGVDRREARRRARAAFGGVEAHKDAVRDGRGGWVWLSGLQRDIRDGLRSLAKRPAFTAVAILSLALGIGANTAIFSLVNAVILRDSPVERPEEVVNLYLHQASFEFGTLSYPDFEDVRDGAADVFSDIAASHFVPLTIDRGEGRGVGLAPAEAVTGSYFPMLGIEAAVGRTLLPSDDVSRGGHPVVMLDYRYWQSAFAGDPDVVGHEMRVGGRAYTVIGVGPPDFAGTVRGLTPTFYVPFMMAEELNGFPLFDERGHTSLFVKARLRPGVTLPQAEAAVGAVAAQLTRDRIENWDPAGQFALLPLTD
ncbi:MAG: ABC transporter permease, partial [Acidobacteria bacterium]|nr:ABC transporter permease [Acidobacteriota bacterium]